MPYGDRIIMMTGRLCVIFRPGYGKHPGDISRKLDMIERVIRGAGGGDDLIVHPHDTAAFRFIMPDGTDHRTAESVVSCLNSLQDDDGMPLVEAEQGSVPIVHTQPERALAYIH